MKNVTARPLPKGLEKEKYITTRDCYKRQTNLFQLRQPLEDGTEWKQVSFATQLEVTQKSGWNLESIYLNY